MFIQGIGTALPAQRYSQSECWDAFTQSPHLSQLGSRSQAILRKVLLGDNGIEYRHFALDKLEHAFSLDPNTLHKRFAQNAPALAAQAATRACDRSALRPSQIDALVITTCTGYLCPGLTSYVSERLGLGPHAALYDLVGHGCGAALPALQLAASLLKSGHARHVLSISVEICSAAFYLDNDPGVLISACLFADGAAAAVLSADPAPGLRPVQWLDFQTALNTADRDLLRFETTNGMLRNVLDKSVPLLVVQQVRQVRDQLLHRASLAPADIPQWIMHPGGRDVLAALHSGLDIPQEKLRFSAEVLRDCGNISSPSVLFALQRALASGANPGKWFMSAFGAGLSCHGALLEVQ